MQALQLPRSLPVVQQQHGHTLAECQTCSLVSERQQTETLAYKPQKNFNGLMIVGEGPGAHEARLKTPFVGPAGRLLDALLKQVGIERADTYITNATLCMPPYEQQGENAKKKSFLQRHPMAVPSCLPRLLTEIQDVRPRVIVALGQVALTALTGEDFTKNIRVPFECPLCGNPEKRKKSCEGCKGYKTRVVESYEFKSAEQIGFVAGGVYDAERLQLPGGVKYLMPTYHPSFLLRSVDTKSDKKVGGQFLASAALQHLAKARFLLEHDRVFTMRHRVTSDPDEVAAFTQRPGLYAVDLEWDSKVLAEITTIKCVGIGHVDSDEVLVVNTDGRHRGDPLVEEVVGFLEDPAVDKGFQNGIADTTVIKYFWRAEVASYKFDSLIAHRCVAADEPHDLSHIAFTYTDVEPWKPPKKLGGIDSFKTDEELWLYNARDVRTTGLSIKSLMRELDAEGVRRVHDLDLAMFEVGRGMRVVGVPFDVDARERFAKVSWDKEKKLLAKLRELCLNEHLNPNKPADLAWALHDQQGPFRLQVVARTQTGQPQVDKAVRIKLLSMCAAGSGSPEARAFIETLTEWKRLSKERSTYVGKIATEEGEDGIEHEVLTPNGNYVIIPGGMVLDEHGRVHPDWKPGEARTGRWSSSPNFQNFPKHLRNLVVAPPGKCFVGADFAALEFRIAAAVTGDREMIRRCLEADEGKKLDPDWDPHSYVAWHAFGKTFTDLLLKDPTHDPTAESRQEICPCQTCLRKQLREVAKTVFYALGYGAGADTIMITIYDKGYRGPALDVRRVQNIINAIFRAYPEFRDWRERQIEEVKRTKRVRDPLLGRYRDFPLGQVESTIALNFPIQSSAGSIMNLGTWDLYIRLQKEVPTAFIMAQVHDAIYVECFEKDAERVRRIVEESLSCTLVLVPGSRPMEFPASAKIAKNWKDAA